MKTRKPMDEETKKKTSEALTKNKSAKSTPVVRTRSEEMKTLEANYNKSQKNIDLLKNSVGVLKSTIVKPPKDATKDQKEEYKKKKEEVKKNIEEIRNKIKAEKENQKRIKDEARGVKIREKAAKDIEKAAIKLDKIAANQNKLDALEIKTRGLLNKAKTPEQKQRAQEALQRISDNRSKQSDNDKKTNDFIKQKQLVVSSKNVVQKSNKGFFRFSEVCFSAYNAGAFWRELRTPEKKINFKFLDDSYNSLINELNSEIDEVANANIETSINSMQNKLKSGDVAAVAAMSFFNFPKISSILNKYIKASFEVGKQTASDELSVERPATPSINNQINNYTSGAIADEFINSTNTQAKESIRIGILNGISATAIAATLKVILGDSAKNFTKTKTIDIVAESLAIGRKMVFDKNVSKIQAYQRSEILDAKTCPICYELDGVSILPNDPLANLDQVHTNCRGLWVPVLENEDFDTNDIGVSKKIRNAFETDNRFGIPQTNAFKQLAKK